eukprot:PITA_09842
MVEEYDSIFRNSAWEIVLRLEGKSMVGSRGIYKVKQVADGSVEKYKERFVARGFSQIEGIDYEETFAPVARYSSIQTILALSAQMGWHIHQMDVKTAFLNGVIEEVVYIEQPGGFEGKYAREILEKLNMHGCKPVDTPLFRGWRKEDATSVEEVDATVYRQLVGSLMYLVNTRPDICYAVN